VTVDGVQAAAAAQELRRIVRWHDGLGRPSACAGAGRELTPAASSAPWLETVAAAA
jgi:hypothetical protein